MFILEGTGLNLRNKMKLEMALLPVENCAGDTTLSLGPRLSGPHTLLSLHRGHVGTQSTPSPLPHKPQTHTYTAEMMSNFS